MQASELSKRSHKQRMATMKIVWFALLASPCLLGFQLYTAAQAWPPAAEASKDLSPIMPLVGMAALAALMSFVLPGILTRILLKPKLTPQQDPQQRAWGVFFISYVVRLALIEMISVLGFLAATMTQDMQKYWPAFAVSMTLYLIARPGEDALKNIERQLQIAPL